MKIAMFSDLRNASDNHFTDISSEVVRVYEFSDITIKINSPVALSVSDSGGHRILDHAGECHYIPSGWVHLHWIVKDDSPHFVK